jgi:hypothetical protein
MQKCAITIDYYYAYIYIVFPSSYLHIPFMYILLQWLSEYHFVFVSAQNYCYFSDSMDMLFIH